MPAGPALMVRLCHQLALECEELPRPFHQQVMALPSDTPIPDGGHNPCQLMDSADAPSILQVLVPGGHHISLPYKFLVPCLCIEVGCPPLQPPEPLPLPSHEGWGHILP